MNYGNRNTLGDCNTLGNWNTLGDDNTLGDWNTLGNSFSHGKRLTIEGVKARKMATVSNLDGSGRQVLIVIHTQGVLIRAGCFKGNLIEFCEKAESEGKTYYSTVVKAMAEAMLAEADRRCETGGWECE